MTSRNNVLKQTLGKRRAPNRSSAGKRRASSVKQFEAPNNPKRLKDGEHEGQ